MSDLRYKTIEELTDEKQRLERVCGEYSQKLNNASERLKWVNKYLREKTPIPMTMQQIEEELGHKVTLL